MARQEGECLEVRRRLVRVTGTGFGSDVDVNAGLDRKVGCDLSAILVAVVT